MRLIFVAVLAVGLLVGSVAVDVPAAADPTETVERGKPPFARPQPPRPQPGPNPGGYAVAVYLHRLHVLGQWRGVARCESSLRWTIQNPPYYGGLQFTLGTWAAYGGTGNPAAAPSWRQAEVADQVRIRSGLHHWPNCGRYYGTG